MFTGRVQGAKQVGGHDLNVRQRKQQLRNAKSWLCIAVLSTRTVRQTKLSPTGPIWGILHVILIADK